MGTQYTLTFVNSSTLSRSFICFQEDPAIGVPDVMSLAWYTKFTHPGTTTDFEWFMNYSLIWSEQGNLKPGVKFTASDIVDADPKGIEHPNKISLQYVDDGFKFANPSNQGSKGSLTIDTEAGFPAGKASIGIGMSGSGTFAVPAIPQDHTIFTPHPQYWVAFGNYKKGTVLDITQISNKKQVIFPTNVFAMTAIYNDSGDWDIRPTSEVNAIIAEVGLLEKLGYQLSVRGNELLGISLQDGKTTTSQGKKNGVRLQGIPNQKYSESMKVTIKNLTTGTIDYQVMTTQTDVNKTLGNGEYSVTNNSGGTINYSWLEQP